MFQFRRFPTYTYLIQYMLPCGGFPHSEISGSQLICSSPKLIAAYHVLHRLLMPRHSPCALLCLTSSAQTSYHSFPSARVSRPVESSLIPLHLLSNPNPLRWASDLFHPFPIASASSLSGQTWRVGPILLLVLLKFELCRLHHWISFTFPTKL